MIAIGMSTSCIFPLGPEHAFRMARLTGFDGVEVMVTTDSVTQDAKRLADLSRRYALPILAIHAPVLFLTPFVFGRDPAGKLDRSAALAAELGAPTVVVHPPFRWQSSYALRFEEIVRETSERHGVTIAVENMFPWRIGTRPVAGYAPSPNPLNLDVDAMTLDFSHAALSGLDSLELAREMGSRLRHVHLTDGTASADEGAVLDAHLLPGRGTQPVAETLRHLAATGWSGSIVAEVKARNERGGMTRLEHLEETIAFARRELGQAPVAHEPLEVSRPARRSRRTQDV